MAVWNANLLWLVALLWGLAHRFRSTAQLASPPLMSAHVLGGLIDGSGTHDQISHPGLSVRNCTTGPTSAHLLINRCGQMFCDLETHCWDPCISERMPVYLRNRMRGGPKWMHGAVRQQTGPVSTGLVYNMADLVRVVCYSKKSRGVLFLCFQRISCLND